jgi:hypothetical protein
MAPTSLSRLRRAPQDLEPVAPRVVADARVSTAEQSTNGVSLDEQERRIRAHCDSEDVPGVTCQAETFDELVEAVLDLAPELAQADAGVAKGERIEITIVAERQATCTTS